MRTNWKHKETGMWINGRYFAAMALMLAVTLLTLALGAPAKAQSVDGNFLHRQCEERTGLETAYVAGVVDALVASGSALFVFPTNSILKQSRDVVCNGLAANPEYRSIDASILVHAYLAKAFPDNIP